MPLFCSASYRIGFWEVKVAKNNFYAVLSGRRPGIYTSWRECQQQVTGFKGARFKGFVTRQEAEGFMAGTAEEAAVGEAWTEGTVIFVDGSYMGGNYSWGFAVYQDGKLLAAENGAGTSAEAAKLHNVAGEMEAARQAVLWAEATGTEPVTICHDYEGIAAWPLGRWQAKLPQTQAYAAFMQPRLTWVRFRKVAGHTGVEGNELADRLAKEALVRV